MTIHSMVYIVLSVLSLVAVHAISAPVTKPDREQQDVEPDADGVDGDHRESVPR